MLVTEKEMWLHHAPVEHWGRAALALRPVNEPNLCPICAQVNTGLASSLDLPSAEKYLFCGGSLFADNRKWKAALSFLAKTPAPIGFCVDNYSFQACCQARLNAMIALSDSVVVHARVPSQGRFSKESAIVALRLAEKSEKVLCVLSPRTEADHWFVQRLRQIVWPEPRVSCA